MPLAIPGPKIPSPRSERSKHDGHGVVDGGLLATEARGELAEQGRADADDDREDQDLDAGGDNVAEDTLGHESRLAEQAERDQHKARERREFEFYQRDEELHR